MPEEHVIEDNQPHYTVSFRGNHDGSYSYTILNPAFFILFCVCNISNDKNKVFHRFPGNRAR